MYKTILVTGSSGVIGGALHDLQGEHPDRQFIFVRSKDCDLTRIDAVKKYVAECRPDAIIHLAAVSGGIELSMKRPATLLRDNILMNLNIMEAARECGVKKVIMTLSSGMYPADAPNPLREESIHNGYPHPTTYSYAFAKRLVDPQIRAYRTEYNLNAIGLIPNAILGERSNFSYDAATMVPALIRRFYEHREGNDQIVVWGDGSPLREITYGKDMAKVYLWCLDHYDNEQVLNVGSTEEVSVKDIAYMISDILKIDRARIVFDTTKPSGQHRKATDNSRFMALSNFHYTPIREALNKTVEYFASHYPDSNTLRL